MGRYFRFPLHATSLLLVGTITLGLLIALKASWAGIALGAVLVSWFFKYCFVLLDAIIAGAQEPPVLSVEMVNPLDEQRPVVIGTLIGLECWGVYALYGRFGTIAALAAIGVAAFALPANIAALSIGRTVFQVVWPPALFEIFRSLGRDYFLLNVVTALFALACYAMVLHGASIWLALIIVQFLLLMVFSLIGGAVFEHRHSMGIETKTHAERIAERNAREHQSERLRMLDHAFSSFRVRKPVEGWQQIEAWLQVHARGDKQDSEYRALIEAASKWDDVRAADRLVNDYVALLLARRATGEALKIVEQRLAANPQFQVSPAALGVRVAELAGAAGKRGLQRRLAAPGGGESA